MDIMTTQIQASHQIGVGEASQLLGVHRRTVVRRITRGEFAIVSKLLGTRGPYILDRTEVLSLVAAK